MITLVNKQDRFHPRNLMDHGQESRLLLSEAQSEMMALFSRQLAHATQEISHPTPYTLHPTPYAMHPTP